MATESGYSNQKKYGEPQYKTIQGVGSSKFGVNTAQMYLYDVSTSLPIIDAALDPDDNKKIIIEITGHGARKGDVLRIQSPATLSGLEYDIVEILDADFLVVFDIASEQAGDSIPQAGDTVRVCRWVTASSDIDGLLQVSSAPVRYVRDGVDTTVSEDTGTPANSRPFPVKLVGTSGDINITAGDLNIAMSHVNDSVRLGNGVNLTEVNAAGELLVRDADSIAELQDIEADVEAMSAKLPATLGTKTKATSLAVTLSSDETLPLPSGASTEAKQDDILSDLGDIKTAVESMESAVGLDGSPKPPSVLVVGGVDGVGDVQEFRTNVAGELLVSFGAAGFATETTLDEMNDKFANNFGAAAGAVRTAAQIGNAAGAADFNSGADSAQTLRVSANLKRSGNDLSYGTGVADANTLRVAMATGAGVSTEAKQDTIVTALATLLTELQLKADLSETQPVSLAAQPTIAGTLTSIQKAVGLAAVRATVAGTAPNAARKKLWIKPSKNNTGSIFIGPAGVTIADGMEIIGPDRVEFELDSSDYYLISDTAAQVVEIMEKV